MPSSGPTTLWPFSETEELGSSLDRGRLLRELMNNTFEFESSSQIRPSNASSSQQGTTSTATEILMAQESVRRDAETMQGRYRNNYRDRFVGARPALSAEYGRSVITGRSAGWIIMDEVSSFPESPRDDHLDAIRYALIYGGVVTRHNFGAVTVENVYSPSLTQLIEPPKEPEMNEIMTALEAMIRRVVKEEIALQDDILATSITLPAFDKAFEKFIDENKPKFAAMVSQGALDMPWFDDAIKAEVAEAVPAAAGYTFADKAAFDMAVLNSVRESHRLAEWVHDSSISSVRDLNFTVRVS